MPSQLYLFDCDRKVDIYVPTARIIVIGRGDSLLQCEDNRISRSHGTLQLDDAADGRTVRITSTHSNPIYIRTGADGVLNILAKDLTATLKEGDRFALLPDQYWYEVRFGEITAPDEVVTSTGPTLRVRTMEEVNSGPVPDVCVGEKRKNGEEAEADSPKKLRVETAEATSEAEVTSNQEPEGEAPAEIPAEEPATTSTTEVSAGPEAQSAEVKPDPDAVQSDAAEGSSSGPKSPQEQKPVVDVKKETADSTGPPLRPSCQFGIGCYRHTPDHRAQFAHPNDQDYRRPAFPPAPDDAPHCPFGASCYRRNPQHFREYQHPDSTAVAPVSTVPVVPVVRVVPPPARRRNHFARDILMAAIINDPGDDDGSNSDDDDDQSLFGSGSESDEYRPDGGGDPEDEELDSELDSHEEDEE